VVIAPNNDPGTDEIFSVIEALPKSRFRLIPSMRFNYFSELMKNASAMIGNSSAGVREAPFLGLPSLDIGTRQNNRALADSVTVCSAMDTQGIENFLQIHWNKRAKGDAGYGDGQATQHFVQIIQNKDFWSKADQKVFHQIS
jgi:UDP-N-acetylglucosamine 2-epimerase (hydrolysing)